MENWSATYCTTILPLIADKINNFIVTIFNDKVYLCVAMRVRVHR
jgi:hypothetical protein